MRCIAVINQKGGVGKTTTTLNLGAGLARRGKTVLLLDLDPQGNLSLHIDRRPTEESKTMTALMLENTGLEELVEPTSEDRLYIVPSDASLAGVEQVLANKIGREMVLQEALAKYAQGGEITFDYVLLDCPPSLGVITANALCAANEVLIPMQADYFSLQGMAKLTEIIELVRARLNPDLRIAKVLPCMVDVRTRLTAEVLDEIERHFGDLVSEYPIRANVKLAEAPSFGRTIFQHDPESNGAWDYGGLAAEILGEPYELAEDEEDYEDELEGEYEDDVEDAFEGEDASFEGPVVEAASDAEASDAEAGDTDDAEVEAAPPQVRPPIEKLDPDQEEAIVKAMLEGRPIREQPFEF